MSQIDIAYTPIDELIDRLSADELIAASAELTRRYNPRNNDMWDRANKLCVAGLRRREQDKARAKSGGGQETSADRAAINTAVQRGTAFEAWEYPHANHTNSQGTAEQRHLPCSLCLGAKTRLCTRCLGTGHRPAHEWRDYNGNSTRHFPVNRSCSVCSGQGRVTCSLCHGSGKGGTVSSTNNATSKDSSLSQVVQSPHFENRPVIQTPDYELRWQQGVTLSERGQWQDAIQVFQALIQAYPQFAPAYLSLAWCYVSVKDFNNAIGCYLPFLKLEPLNATGWAGLGNCYSLLQNWSQSEECLTRALQLEPNNSIHHYNLGRLCLWMERYQESFPHFQNALQCDPNSVISRIGLAELFWLTGYQTEAWREQQYLNSLDPQAASWLASQWNIGPKT